MKDAEEVWVTVSGNRGLTFLKECDKPFYHLRRDAELRQEPDALTAAVVRQAKAGEIFEVLEGPRKIESRPVLRAKGKALKDGAVGFFDVRDGLGVERAAVADFHACVAQVAMTDDLDMKKGKVVRKLAVGEVFSILEGPVESGDSGSMLRVRGRALKDGQEGWITPRGNAGSVYTQESTKHYRMSKETPLEKQDGDVVRGARERSWRSCSARRMSRQRRPREPRFAPWATRSRAGSA